MAVCLSAERNCCHQTGTSRAPSVLQINRMCSISSSAQFRIRITAACGKAMSVRQGKSSKATALLSAHPVRIKRPEVRRRTSRPLLPRSNFGPGNRTSGGSNPVAERCAMRGWFRSPRTLLDHSMQRHVQWRRSDSVCGEVRPESRMPMSQGCVEWFWKSPPQWNPAVSQKISVLESVYRMPEVQTSGSAILSARFPTSFGPPSDCTAPRYETRD